MRGLIKKILKESSNLDWIMDVPGEEGYGEKYRFFDIHVCFSEYDDEYGCYEGYSAFIKIPKYEVDGKWKGKAGMKLVVTKWAIENEQFDSEDYSAIEYVREIDKDEYLKATGDPDLINESSDWDWIDDIEPVKDGWDLYHNKLIGDTFTISLKPEVMSDGCVDDYFPYGADYETEVKVMLVEVQPETFVVTNGCNTKSTEVLLLKFDEDTDGHDGTSDHFSDEKNGEIANICDDRCWWVYPGLINVNY